MYKKIITYEDSNDNGIFLLNLFVKIEFYLEIKLNWEVFNVQVIPLCKEETTTGKLTPERQIVYNFQQKILKEFTINISNKNLINLLKYIKTIEEGTFKFINKNDKIIINIIDGYIIEIESNLKFIDKLAE